MDNVKVLGSGCAKCRTLETRTGEALAGLGIAVPIEKVTDYTDIASWGVVSTPALVVDDQVVLAGRVPTVEQLSVLLQGARL